jgi:Ca2+-binding EF-hand superfamily protein
MSELKKIVKPERGDNYDEANFEKLFQKFDDNGDGFMEKKEIAVFIKKVFKKTDAQKQKEKAASRPANQKLLSEYLGSYATDNITGNIDELWDTSDADKNGMLDKEECKIFLSKVKEMMKEERANNYDESTFDDIFKKYDDDSNGFIEKSEMTTLIKKTFKKPK